MLLEGVKPIGVKRVLTKLDADGQVEKYKARLMAKRYGQRHGIDYIEVFAQVARLDTIWVMLATTAQYNWRFFNLM